MPAERDEPLARPIMVAAMAVMIIATVAGNGLFARNIDPAPRVLLGTLYLALATLGWMWCERRGRAAMCALAGVLLALFLVLQWVTDQALFILVVPVLLYMAIYGAIRYAAIEIVAITAYSAWLNWRIGMGVVDNYMNATGFVPGAILTLGFAHVLLRERRARAELRRYALEVEDLAATRERNRIARDIHDSVGHCLTVVNVQIEAARVTSDRAAADECLDRAQTLARNGLGELRRSVSMLRAGPLAQRRFGGALEELLEDTRRAGLDATLTVDGTPRALPPAVEFALYRAAQEALTNVVRHAQATRARCAISYRDAEVRLTVEDDGIGAVATDGGFGLAGMRERVVAVGGTVDVRTGAGRGFTLDVRVPM